MIGMRKIYWTCLVVLPLLWSGARAQEKTGWDRVPDILANISAPVFPDRTFDVTEFGARSGMDFNSLPAIAAAIDRCCEAGGGRVNVPPGTWYVGGPIVLKSRVDLHIEEGARLVFSTDPGDYLPMVLTKWEGTECYNFSPFIYSYHSTDVALTGKGEIDGRGAVTFHGWRALQDPATDRLRRMGSEDVPVHERTFGEGWYLRPCMIQFFGCTNVLVDGITLYDAPFWIIHPVYCDNVIVRNVRIDSDNFNNDGCDPESSSNVLIENVSFNVGDDGIAIKSGRDRDGWRVGRATENVVIRNCHFARWAITIGSEMSGGVRNVFIEDCTIDSCRNGIYFKSNLDRGGFFEHLYMRNITADICHWGVINFRTDYHGYRGGNHPTLFRNITIENVTCNRVDSVAIMANGIPEAKLHDITLRNIEVKKAPKATRMQNVVGLVLDNVRVNGKTVTGENE